jgi:type VI secretion system protein ImpE
MTIQAEQSLRDGNLSQALAQLQDQVRSHPAQADYRVFLFQLLAVLGEWQRALTQLDVAADLDASTLAMVQTYREAVRCELYRKEVFTGKRSPLLFGEPEPWVALVLQALGLSSEGQQAKAQELRAQAYDTVELVSGTVDGQPFEWIADADTRLGPMLEAIVNGNYYWIPFQRIQHIQLEAPEDLRDLVWAPAQFTWSNGGQTVGLIPTRYPESDTNEDAQILMSHRTEWLDRGDEEFIGLGQRIFATDSNEYPLLDVREIVLDTANTGDTETTDTAAEEPEG